MVVLPGNTGEKEICLRQPILNWLFLTKNITVYYTTVLCKLKQHTYCYICLLCNIVGDIIDL